MTSDDRLAARRISELEDANGRLRVELAETRRALERAGQRIEGLLLRLQHLRASSSELSGDG